MQVRQVGDRTFYGGVAREVQEDARESPLRVRLAGLAKALSRLGYIAAALVAVADLFHSFLLDNAFDPARIAAAFTDAPTVIGHLLHAITLAITVVVVAVPEGLPMMITVVLSSNMRRMLKDHVLVRKLVGIETSGSLNILFTDKTGTLTKGVFEVNGVHHSEMEEEKLLEYAALAESASSHPISRSIQRAYGKEIDRTRVSEIEEISGNGVTAKVDGKLVAAGNDKLMKRLGITPIACHSAGTIIHIAIDGKYMGHILISDVEKPTSKEAIRALKSAGIEKTVMLTGDAKRVADQVAEKLGLDEVYSELLPSDKVAQVERLLAEKPAKAKLAFVGDGINDAPVLGRADIGIAMGAMGSDAAIEAADVVLMDDDPLKIVKAIKISKKCIRIVYQNIIFALTIKAICLILGAIGIANMWVAIFADVGVMVIAVLNAIRALYVKNL